METTTENASAQGAEAKETKGKGKKEAQVREIGKNLPMVQQKAITLAQTIKTVTDLHTKVRHLDKLEEYTDQLSKFTVKHKAEDLDSGGGYYAGCKLELRDDDNRQFTLKHPVLVKEVIEFLFKRMEVKRQEIEASIKLPVTNAA
jgi:hypothetical protein